MCDKDKILERIINICENKEQYLNSSFDDIDITISDKDLEFTDFKCGDKGMMIIQSINELGIILFIKLAICPKSIFSISSSV